MALAHSFYCWGQLAVVVVTTALLAALGTGLWPLLPVLWAVVPLVNLAVLLRVPMPATVPDEHRTSLRSLFGTPLFLAALVLMATGGAAELTMAQWSSFFAEQGTGVPKEVGDLLGPGLFALLMGLGGSRTACGGRTCRCGRCSPRRASRRRSATWSRRPRPRRSSAWSRARCAGSPSRCCGRGRSP